VFLATTSPSQVPRFPDGHPGTAYDGLVCYDGKWQKTYHYFWCMCEYCERCSIQKGGDSHLIPCPCNKTEHRPGVHRQKLLGLERYASSYRFDYIGQRKLQEPIEYNGDRPIPAWMRKPAFTPARTGAEPLSNPTDSSTKCGLSTADDLRRFHEALEAIRKSHSEKPEKMPESLRGIETYY